MPRTGQGQEITLAHSLSKLTEQEASKPTHSHTHMHTHTLLQTHTPAMMDGRSKAKGENMIHFGWQWYTLTHSNPDSKHKDTTHTQKRQMVSLLATLCSLFFVAYSTLSCWKSQILVQQKKSQIWIQTKFQKAVSSQASQVKGGVLGHTHKNTHTLTRSCGTPSDSMSCVYLCRGTLRGESGGKSLTINAPLPSLK